MIIIKISSLSLNTLLIFKILFLNSDLNLAKKKFILYFFSNGDK